MIKERLVLHNVHHMFNILFVFAALPYGDDNNDIYSNDDYEDAASASNGGNMGADNEAVITKLPHFVTTGQNMLVNEKSTIKLPCIVDRLGKL